MRILWHSNAPWAITGYGNQTALFAPRLRTAGHDIIVSTYYGLDGSRRQSEGMWILPCGHDMWGNDVLPAHAQYYKADIVITLMDVWVLQANAVDQVAWCPWLPIDHDPVSPGVARILEHAYQPIAYSRFGEQKLRERGFNPLYVPHGVDTNELYPISQAEAREKLGCNPDAFLVGIVAANKGFPSRKCFDQQIRAFAEFQRRHDEAVLYIHSDFPGTRGEPLGRIIEMAGIPSKAIAQPDQYEYAAGLLDTRYMRHMYNCLDVLLNCTRGEGFGIPILEAQACGTPVIVTDFSAMPELVFGGYTVEVGEDDRFFSQESYQYVPRPSAIVARLEELYALSKTRRDDLGEAARQGALAYDADRVVEQYWQPALARVAAQLAYDKAEASVAETVGEEIAP